MPMSWNNQLFSLLVNMMSERDLQQAWLLSNTQEGQHK